MKYTAVEITVIVIIILIAVGGLIGGMLVLDWDWRCLLVDCVITK